LAREGFAVKESLSALFQSLFPAIQGMKMNLIFLGHFHVSAVQFPFLEDLKRVIFYFFVD
tara:strand:+ start:354 stop:533 length:180 start_codon:yes stop_codon:yes gene_type:complete